MLIFAVFYILKLFGYCDYTGRYDIEEITSQQKNYNSPLMIDNDIRTTWGIGDIHYKNEKINISFRKVKDITSVWILVDKLEKKVPEIAFLYSEDSINYSVCKYGLEVNEIEYKYNFILPCRGRYMQLVYLDEEPGSWLISEIKIYDK